jgi:hypothetical protein
MIGLDDLVERTDGRVQLMRFRITVCNRFFGGCKVIKIAMVVCADLVTLIDAPVGA